MLDAHYGRMKTGRCVSRDYGYMGCSVSVLHIMDRICSGRRWCEYGVPRLREVIQPCPKDLISYLEASFECTQAIDLSNIRCNSSIFLDATNSTVYVSGASDLDHHAVSTSAVSSPSSPAAASVASPGAAAAAAVAFFHSCPLHVRVRPRQTINITLRSFGHYPEADDSPTVESGILRFCSAHMFITEGQRRHSGPLCPGRLRERNMYQSRDSTVGLYFSQQPRKLINAGQRWTFILKIEAVGCADMRTPPNAWLERLDDRAILRCNYTQEVWYLTCRDNDWVGVPGNCTEVIIATKEEKIATTEDSRIPFGLAVAVSSGIVLGFIVGFAMLLFVFFHRRRGHVDRPRAIKMLAMPCPNGISCVGGGGGGGSSGGETRVVDPLGVAASSPYPRRVLLQCTYNDRNNPTAGLCSRLARQLPPPAGGFCPTYVGSCDIGGAFGSACNKCNVYSRRPDAAEALTTYLCTNAAGLPADVKGADMQRRQSSMVAATCDIKEGGAKAEEEENSANTFRSMTIDNTYETTRVDGGTKMAANESGTKMATEEIGTKMASRDSTGSKQPDVVQLFQTDIYSEPRVSLCSDVNSAPLAQPDTTYFVAPLQAKLSTNRVPIHDVIGKYDVSTCNDV